MSLQLDRLHVEGPQKNRETLEVIIGSDNGCPDTSSLSDSDSTIGRRFCGFCGNRLWLDRKAQKYCNRACYRASIRVAIEDRFWSKVNKNGQLPADVSLGQCWLWTASLTLDGYGQIADVVDGKRRPVCAHRKSWEFVHGPIPEGLFALHKCDVRACVRESHLFLGTQPDNLADARAKGRLNERLPRSGRLGYADRLAIFEAVGDRGLGLALAEQYGVTRSAISQIRSGRFARLSVSESKAVA